MEEEDRIFYDSEVDVFGGNQDDYPVYHPLPLLSNHSLDNPPNNPLLQPRAYNPLERLRDMPE
jgi:hypothetical protein